MLEDGNVSRKFPRVKAPWQTAAVRYRATTVSPLHYYYKEEWRIKEAAQSTLGKANKAKCCNLDRQTVREALLETSCHIIKKENLY